MAKSLENGVTRLTLFQITALEAFSILLVNAPTQEKTATLLGEKFEAAYNGASLANDLGNLVQRVAKMVQSYRQEYRRPQSEHDMGPYRQAMESYII